MQHIRRFKLPHGVRVTFSYPAPPWGMHVEWDPELPQFTSNRAARRFETAYLAARAEFLQDVAQLIGGKVLLLDVASEGQVERMATIEPKPVQ